VEFIRRFVNLLMALYRNEDSVWARPAAVSACQGT